MKNYFFAFFSCLFFSLPISAEEIKLNGTVVLTDIRDKSERIFYGCDITVNVTHNNNFINNDFPEKYTAKCDNIFLSERWAENSPIKPKVIISEQQRDLLKQKYDEISVLTRDVNISYYANIKIENIKDKTERVLLNCKIDSFVQNEDDLDVGIFPKTFSSQCQNLFLTERWNNENTKISVLIDTDKHRQIINEYEKINEKHCYYRKREDERKKRRKICSYINEGNIHIP